MYASLYNFFLINQDLCRIEQVNSVMKQFATDDLLWKVQFDRKSYSINNMLLQWEEKNLNDKASSAYKIALHAQPPQ